MLPNLALAGVRAAPLNDELAEDFVGEEDPLYFGHVLRGIRHVLPHTVAKRRFHPGKVRPKTVYADCARRSRRRRDG